MFSFLFPTLAENNCRVDAQIVVLQSQIPPVVTTESASADASNSSANSFIPIAGAAAGGLIVAIVVIVIVVKRRGNSSAPKKPARPDRSVVAFENPIYNKAKAEGIYDNYDGPAIDPADGLYFEAPAFEADTKKKDNPLFDSSEQLNGEQCVLLCPPPFCSHTLFCSHSTRSVH